MILTQYFYRGGLKPNRPWILTNFPIILFNTTALLALKQCTGIHTHQNVNPADFQTGFTVQQSLSQCLLWSSSFRWWRKGVSISSPRGDVKDSGKTFRVGSLAKGKPHYRGDYLRSDRKRFSLLGRWYEMMQLLYTLTWLLSQSYNGLHLLLYLFLMLVITKKQYRGVWCMVLNWKNAERKPKEWMHFNLTKATDLTTNFSHIHQTFSSPIREVINIINTSDEMTFSTAAINWLNDMKLNINGLEYMWTGCYSTRHIPY